MSKLFGSLFGTPKAGGGGGGGGSGPVAQPAVSVEATMDKMQRQLADLEKKQTQLKKQSEQAALRAKERIAKGDKRGAMMEIQRKKQYDKQYESTFNMMTNIEAMQMTMSSAQQNKEYIGTLKTGATVIKTLGPSVEEVDDVRDAFDETMADQEEIQSAIGESWVRNAAGSDELDAEFAALQEEVMGESMGATAAPAAGHPAAAVAAGGAGREAAPAASIPAMPAAPSGAVSAPAAAAPAKKAVAASMDDELAALEAL